MNIDAIPIGKNPPDDLNVIIEVPLGGEPIKYEIDKASGALFVDRFLYTPMRYPGNYGFIPHTLCGDGDALDVLVMNSRPLVPGAVVRCRPVGVLFMEDDGGQFVNGQRQDLFILATVVFHEQHADRAAADNRAGDQWA